MKYTLLKTVQLILSGMDSDEINDINETTESVQVVDILEQTFNDLASTIDFSENWGLFQLESTGIDTPTITLLPSNVGKLEWVQYNIAGSDEDPDWQPMTPINRTAFLSRQAGLDPDATNVFSQVYTSNDEDFTFYGYNDKDPVYYTSFNDSTLIFDNYDATKYTTLPGGQFRCYGMLIPEFTRSNDWIAPLEPRQFSLYFNEAKSQAFVDLKQIANQKAEQRARRGWVQMQRKQPTVPPGEILESWTPNFGRKRMVR